jgi:alginate O-acetyltransferase complex protein AlgI
MVFSSLVFLFLFLPIFLITYHLVPRGYKNAVALLSSLLFYAWGAPKVVFLLVIFSFLDYRISLLFGRFKDHPQGSKRLMAVSIFANISLLGYFKYSDFFVHEVNNLLSVFGQQPFQWTEIVLPIGISFFTFQKISYVIDVYRGTTEPADCFSDFLLYVVLFPQLIAGPIIRYHDVEKQIRSRVHSVDLFLDGVVRFSVGLGKKLLIANAMGEVADKAFSMPATSLPISYTWLGAMCYSIQIYFDFSGYSDMAIGLGRMIGFRYRENFNMPYISQNITEFWRRWHISLSSWMKQYLYIPLGGNRCSMTRTYVNLWIVFLISGIWHGAYWTFLAWGAYHGIFLTLDKAFWLKSARGINKALSITITYVIVLFGWVIFRSPDMGYAWDYGLRMLGLTGLTPAGTPIIWQEFINNRALCVLAVAAFLSFFPAFPLYQRICDWRCFSGFVMVEIKFVSILILQILSIATLCNSGFNPFIYFRF